MLQHVLLESRLLLFAAWMVTQLIIIGFWSWKRTGAANRMVWIGLLALPALMVVSTVVVTGREHLIHLCETLAKDVERGEAWPIEARLARDFEAADLDRNAFADRLQPALRRYVIGNLRLRRFVISFDSRDRATVELTVTCNVKTADRFINRVFTRWRLVFVRRDDDWRIKSIEAVPTPFSPVRNLRDWIG